MIDTTLSFINKEINNFFKKSINSSEDLVFLTSITNENSSTSVERDNKILFSIINIENETGAYPQWNRQTNPKSGMIATPPIALNLKVIFAANLKDYTEGLKLISKVISYFEQNRVFSISKYPDMPKEIDKLTVEMQNIDSQELNHIWGYLGAKYMPSIVYKIRIIAIEDNLQVNFTAG